MSEIQSGWDGRHFTAIHRRSGGYLSASAWENRHLYIGDVIVPDQYQRKGIGSLLVDAAFREAEEGMVPFPVDRIYAVAISEGGYRLLAGYFGHEWLRSRFDDGTVQIGGLYNPKACSIVMDFPLNETLSVADR